MEPLTLLVTVGLPRCGKSTWAKFASRETNAPIVSPDAIRLALHGQAFIAEAEPYVWAIAKTMVAALFLTGHSTVILDATNTTKERRKAWLSSKWHTVFVPFDTPHEVCEARAKEWGRDDLLPIIERMASQYEPVEMTEGLVKAPAEFLSL